MYSRFNKCAWLNLLMTPKLCASVQANLHVRASSDQAAAAAQISDMYILCLGHRGIGHKPSVWIQGIGHKPYVWIQVEHSQVPVRDTTHTFA